MERACRNKKGPEKGSKSKNKKDNVRFTKKRQVHTVKSQIEDSDSSEEGTSASVNTVKVMNVDEGSDGCWINAELEGHTIKMQIETGSKASIVSYKTYKKCLKHLQLRPSDTIFKAYMGHPVHMKGMTEVLVRCIGQSETLPVCLTREKFHRLV